MQTKVKNRQLKENSELKSTLKLEIEISTDGHYTEEIREVSEAYMEEIIKKAEFSGSGYDFVHKSKTHRIINEYELGQLLERSHALKLLDASGVDNWEGYSDALFNPENDTPISEYNTQTIIEEYWRA